MAQFNADILEWKGKFEESEHRLDSVAQEANQKVKTLEESAHDMGQQLTQLDEELQEARSRCQIFEEKAQSLEQAIALTQESEFKRMVIISFSLNEFLISFFLLRMTSRMNLKSRQMSGKISKIESHFLKRSLKTQIRSTTTVNSTCSSL